jgi:hypothetical protein
VERDPHLVNKIGQAARAAFAKVFEEWNSEADWPIKRTVEAQIAAASLGYKPLYWDPWGEPAAGLIRSHLRSALPAATITDASDAGLLVFRRDLVGRILDSDPTFYRSHGEDDSSAVRNQPHRGVSPPFGMTVKWFLVSAPSRVCFPAFFIVLCANNSNNRKFGHNFVDVL